MSSHTASTPNPNPDATENVSPAETRGHAHFEPIHYGNSEDSSALGDTPQPSRPSAISSSTHHYGTFVVKNAPS